MKKMRISFVFFSFFLFSQVSRRGITCIWFSIEKMVLGIKNMFNFCFFFFLNSTFLTKNVKQVKMYEKMEEI